MKLRVAVTLWLVVGITSPILASGSHGEEPRDRSVLAAVKGLDRTVTYTETKIPLGELVAKVAADTGVQLTAASEVADEPVAVAVKEFPARELLEQLADLLDYQWSIRHSAPDTPRSPPSFEIWQDLASKQREEALRRSLYAAVEQRFQKVLERYKAAVRLSPAEIRRQWDD